MMRSTLERFVVAGWFAATFFCAFWTFATNETSRVLDGGGGWVTNDTDTTLTAIGEGSAIGVGTNDAVLNGAGWICTIQFGNTFVVSGDPARRGHPQPYGYGTNQVPFNETVTNRVETPADAANGTRYVCLGYSGTGCVPVSGATNVVVAVITNESSLTWHWRTDRFLSLGAGAHGTVTGTGGWHTNGARVTVTANANYGYHFTGWTGNLPAGLTNENPVILTLDAPYTLTANFAINRYPIVASAGPNGAISPSGAVYVAHGGGVTFTNTPDPHYHVDEVVADGNRIASAAMYIFSNVTNAHEISVSFAIDRHTLRVNSAHPAVVPAAGVETRNYGTAMRCYVTQTPVANGTTQYLAAGWVGTGSVPAGGPGTNVAFALTNDSAITWLWNTNFWLNTEVGGDGSVNVGDGWYARGASRTIAPTPGSNYYFAFWTGDVPAGQRTNSPLTLTMDQARQVIANFMSISNRAPVVGVATQRVFLASMGDAAVLDASRSFDPDGDMILYSWREYYQNPYLGLIPIGSEYRSKLRVFFPSPGRYRFDVQVSDAVFVSAVRSITVYVPGVQGVMGFSPSDSIVRVPDARVAAYGSQSDALNGVNPVSVSLSDSMGRYGLDGLRPANATVARNYYVKIDRSGFLTSEVHQVSIRPDPGFEDDRKDFAIGRGVRTALLRGTVRDPGGQSIEGVSVSIVPGLGGVKYAVDTDDQGHFQLGGVLQGSWTLQLRRDGFRPEARDINVGSDTNLLDFHLSPTGQVASLTGVVRLWGTDRAIPGVRVMLGTGEYEAFADETGRYTFVGLPAGTYVLTATKNGYEPLRLPAVTVLAGGTATTDFALSFAASGPTVFGKVVDWISGMPVRRATVGIQSDSGLLLRSDVTDCTGYFQLLDVPTGSNQIVRVAAAGYRNRAFAVSFDNYLEMDIQLQRASNWRAPRAPQGSGPVARVAQSAIYLANLQQSATLDGSPSTGANLSYLWRELPDNPRVGLIPPGSTTLPTFQISRFNAPGAYHFELQVRSGDRVSANTATITVFAPGVSGNVHVSPSDGVYGLNQVTVRAFTNYADALRWDLGYVDSKLTLDSPQGDFRLDGLSTGLYWIAAHAQPGSGYLNYGPVARHVNFGSAMRHMAVNMSRVEHRLYGTIRDRASLAVLENVRVVIASGSLSESFRTTTDADGYYVLTAVPEGNNQPVLLVKEGYQTAISKTSIFGDTRKDMTMVRNASGGLADLRGFITAQYMALSYPIPHAEVVVGGGLVRAFTDANGYYEIHGLPPGEYFGQVRKAGYRKAELSQTGSVTLSVGANRVDRTLVYTDQGPVVRGIVVGAGQEAIEGATVTVLRPAAGTRSPGVGVSGVGCQVSGEAGGSLKTLEGEGVVSDAGGFAQLVGVPDGVRHVLVRLPNGGVFTNALTVSGAMEAVITVPPVFEEYDRWVTNYFRDPAASNALVYADADGDGIDNLTECVMDTSPLARNERLCLEPDYAKGCVLTLPVSSRRRMYQIHWSTNLVRGLWQYHGTATAGTGGHLTLSATNDAVVRPKCFYRAGVRLP